MPVAKVRIGGKWVPLGVTREDIDHRFEDLIDALNNADEYIDGAFRDGILSVIEAKKIASLFEQLDLAKATHDVKYDELMTNVKLPVANKNGLLVQKNRLEERYVVFSKKVKDVITAQKINGEEVAEVDATFESYKKELNLLVSLMERAELVLSGGVVSHAFETAQSFVDRMVGPMKSELDQLYSYTMRAIEDGIVYQAELNQIQNQLANVFAIKENLAVKFQVIKNKPERAASPEINLDTAKEAYDQSYTAWLDTFQALLVNNSDGAISTTEHEMIQSHFEATLSQLQIFTSALELAVYEVERQKIGENNTAQLLNNSRFLGFNEHATSGSRLRWWAYVADGWAPIPAEEIAYEGFPILRLQSSDSNAHHIYAHYHAVKPNQTFTFSFYTFLKEDTDIQQLELGLYTYEDKSSLTEIPNHHMVVAIDRTAAKNDWIRVVVTGTIPPEVEQDVPIQYIRAGIRFKGSGEMWISKPMLQQSHYVTAYQDALFNHPWTYEDTDEIDGSYIRAQTLSFDQAYGGKISLGGPAYGDAELWLYKEQDADGDNEPDVIAQISKTGSGFESLTVGTLKTDTAVSRYPQHPRFIYVDPNNGDDENDGTELSQYKTIQRAIDSLPKYLDNHVEIVVNRNSGLFQELEIHINGFSGSGNLTLQFVGFATKLEGQIFVQNCSAGVWISSLFMVFPSVNTGEEYPALISASNSTITLFNCQLYGRDLAYYGLLARDGSRARIRACGFYDMFRAVQLTYATMGSMWDMTGDPVYWASVAGSLFMCNGTRPTGILFENEGGMVMWQKSSNGSRPEPGGTVGTKDPTYGISKPDPNNPPSPPSPILITKTFTTSSANCWSYKYSSWRNDGVAKQGVYRHYGNNRGCWFFGGAVKAVVQGKVIRSIKIEMQRHSKGGEYTSYADVLIRAHNYTSRPSGEPSVSSEYVTGKFKAGDKRIVDITALKGYFQNGSDGIAVYTGSGAASNYAIFEKSIKLTIVYEK
ncbi:hypothetical protein IC620_09450 [Hazenella sp. IB182357]|uniref:Uncharacterized protein n=1 Tax=Polycladospora coralii TaxID=2771432 RepID=A0A926NA22_9BACL|nr:hypothetical protein [Polycladospora coralii]MBD1372578.1 hypothetical protein [Polycladospora coralii]